MIKKTARLLFALIIPLVSFPAGRAAAQNFDLDSLNAAAIAASAEAVPAPSLPEPDRQAAPALKEWTIMVFMNGKNDLAGYVGPELNEMETVGSSAERNIVVQAGILGGPVRRYFITRDDSPSVTSPVLEELGPRDMGSHKELAAFGAWAKANYPAKKYMLIVWNHGTGWESIGKPKTISYDDETENYISTPELARALKAMGGVDVYTSDACLMQQVEVGYELKDHAQYIVGSQETMIAMIFDYAALLGALAAEPAMSPRDLAAAIVENNSRALTHFMEDARTPTQSAIRTAAIPGLAARIDAWAGAVMAAGLKSEVRGAVQEAFRFTGGNDSDLYDFVGLVTRRTQDAAVTAAAAELKAFIETELVLANRTNNNPKMNRKDYGRCRGIAIFVPSSDPAKQKNAVAKAYGKLAWAKASRWHEFMKWYRGK
ncbi:MAG: peptidase C11 clostripain [Elusimicrobia bacterium]|nr:MAG: peptidase C11 clostripain [Elusimicrobiota bacterium]KAF0153974.1 MAG: peptidase C11 clostripain [Elusimicrobiota bacterium]